MSDQGALSMQKVGRKRAARRLNARAGMGADIHEPLSAKQIGMSVIQLARSARSGGLETLAHILDMAALEAQKLGSAGSRGSSARRINS